MSRIVPDAWMSDCKMERVIVHWTAGSHDASTLDEEHYHILVEGDGHLVRGEHTIQDNVDTSNDYAAHTRGCNTRSIGVAVCCMGGAIEQPFHAGKFPMTKVQYEVLATVVADLCEKYDIPVDAKHVLGHGEVQQNLGIKQNGKWDPLILPWDPGKSRSAVANAFRELVKAQLANKTPHATQARVKIFLNDALLTDETLIISDDSWCPLRLLADKLKWEIVQIDADSAQLKTPTTTITVPALIRGARGFVKVKGLCQAAGWPLPTWHATERRIGLTSIPE